MNVRAMGSRMHRVVEEDAWRACRSAERRSRRDAAGCADRIELDYVRPRWPFCSFADPRDVLLWAWAGARWRAHHRHAKTRVSVSRSIRRGHRGAQILLHFPEETRGWKS